MASPTHREFVDEHEGRPAVRGFIHEAAGGTDAALALTHGAGGACTSPLLVAVASTLAAAGITVLRFDLPFRQARLHGPPSPSSAARDRDAIRRAAEILRERGSKRVFVGGQSYGGRQATMLAADEPSAADGLLLLSYPLHPPGRPGQVRTEHFPRLRVASLFISGDRDPFGSPDEIRAAIALIPARTGLVTIEGGAHGLMTKGNRNSLPAVVAERFNVFFDSATR